MTSPSTAIPAATSNPLENPNASASSVLPRCTAADDAADMCPPADLTATPAAPACERRLLATAPQATVPRIASPTDPPTCRPVLSRPDAAPVSLSATLASATSDSGTKVSPMPNPVTSIGPSSPPA